MVYVRSPQDISSQGNFMQEKLRFYVLLIRNLSYFSKILNGYMGNSQMIYNYVFSDQFTTNIPT